MEKMSVRNFAYGLVFVLVICIAVILIWKYSDETAFLKSHCEASGGQFFLYCAPKNLTMGIDNPCCLFPDGQRCDIYELIQGACR